MKKDIIRNGKVILLALLYLALAGCAVDTENRQESNVSDTQTISAEDLNTWVGKYTFFESCNEPDYPPMMMEFEITIYENGYADIYVNGQTTCIQIRAEVYGSSEQISFVFSECLPGDVTSGEWDNSDVLLYFKKDGDDIYTYWGELKDTVLLYSDQISGEIYFVKEVENLQRLKCDVQKEYEKFLSGQREAISEDMKVWTIKELFEQGDSVSYLYCDIDCDGISELHIRSAKLYYILKYENDLMKIIYCGTAYEYPVKNEDLCGIIYCRHGGAPTNIIYQFTTVDQNGTKEGPEYGWYDMNENNVNDEEDLYVMDDTEMDMTTWLEMTDIYRENAEKANQELEWIVNQE